MKLRNYVLPVFMAAASGMLAGGFLYHIAAPPERTQKVYPSLSDSDAKKLSRTQAEDIAAVIFAAGLVTGIRKRRDQDAQASVASIKPPDPW